MRKQIKQGLFLLLAVVMLVACIPTGMAAEDQTSGTVPVIITASAPTFSVTVPTTLPIHMDVYGGITCGNITITNNSSGPVLVEDTQIAALNGWSLVDYDTTTFTNANKGQHRAALRLDRSNGLTATGADTGKDFIPAGGGRQTISLSAKIPYQGTNAVNTSIAKVTFIVGWDNIPIPFIEGPDILEWNSLSVPSADLSVSDGTSGWTWSSSNPNIVSAPSWCGGHVTATDIGKATISASKNGTTITKTIDVTWDKESALGKLKGDYTETLGFLSGGENTTMGGQQVSITSAWDGQCVSCIIHGYNGNGGKVSFGELRVPASAVLSISTNIVDFVLGEDGVWISEQEVSADEHFGPLVITFR